MKKIYHSFFIITLACAALFCSCQKDETVNLTAVFADKPNSNAKVYIEDNYGYWQNGDAVSIRSNGSNGDYPLAVADANPHIATIPNVEEGAPYTAGYPAANVSDLGSGTLKLTIPSEQTYTKAAPYSGHTEKQRIVCPMAAYSDDGSVLRFYNVGAVLAVNILNSTGNALNLYAIEVESDNAPLTGKAAVTVNADGATISGTTETSTMVTLSLSGASFELANGKDTCLYIPVLPISSEAKSKLTVHVKATNGDTKYTFHGVSSAEDGIYINQGEMGSIPVTITTGTAAAFWGQGTAACPYLIESKDDLLRLRTETNAGTSKYCGNGVYYKQTKDTIDISNYADWGSSSNYAIGNTTKAFTANYNGDNNYIKLGISNSTASLNLGVFGVVNGGAKIEKLKVKGSITSSAKYCNCGGIIGLITGPATVEYCINKCNITESSKDTRNSIGKGGIIGCIQTSDFTNNVTVSNCTNLATIESNYNNSGGIVGCAYKGTVTIKDCTNGSLDVASYGTIISLQNYEGGICGYAYANASGSKIENCKNYGNIKTKIDNSTACTTYVAGILGYYSGATDKMITVESCENHGALDQYRHNKSTYKFYTGGIVAANSGGGILVINNCINEGVITSQTTNNYGAEMRAGGILGWNTGASSTVNIDGCSNSGSIVSYINTSNTRLAGGIVGVTEANTILSIKNCCNSGTFSTNFSNAGGMLGHLSTGSATIENSYYISNQTSALATVGGAIGYVVNNANLLVIKNYYVNIQGNVPRGTLIGYKNKAILDSTFTNCYVDATHRSVVPSFNNPISVTDYYAYDASYNLVSVDDGEATSYAGQTTLLDALEYFRQYPSQPTWKAWSQTPGYPPTL